MSCCPSPPPQFPRNTPLPPAHSLLECFPDSGVPDPDINTLHDPGATKHHVCILPKNIAIFHKCLHYEVDLAQRKSYTPESYDR